MSTRNQADPSSVCVVPDAPCHKEVITNLLNHNNSSGSDRVPRENANIKENSIEITANSTRGATASDEFKSSVRVIAHPLPQESCPTEDQGRKRQEHGSFLLSAVDLVMLSPLSSFISIFYGWLLVERGQTRNSCGDAGGYSEAKFMMQGRFWRITLIMIIVGLVAVMNLRQLADLKHSFYLASLIIARYIATISRAISKSGMKDTARHSESNLRNPSDSSISSYSSLTNKLQSSQGQLLGTCQDDSDFASSMRLVQESSRSSSVEKVPRHATHTFTSKKFSQVSSSGNSSSSSSTFFQSHSKVDATPVDDWGQFTEFDGFEDTEYVGELFTEGEIGVSKVVHVDPYYSITKTIRKRRGDQLSVCRLESLQEGDEEEEG